MIRTRMPLRNLTSAILCAGLACGALLALGRKEAAPAAAQRLLSSATERQVLSGTARAVQAAWLAAHLPSGQASEVQLCQNVSPACQNIPPAWQNISPAAPNPINGIDCVEGHCGDRGWNAMQPIPFQVYAQGEYVGHERLAHVPVYRMRVDDQLEFVFRLTRIETTTPYEFEVGDELRIESFTDEKLNRDLVVQPDGSITLRLLGQVRATRQTVAQLQTKIEDLYKKYYKIPAITVTPLKVNTRLEDLRATVDARQGFGGQRIQAKVTPEGTVQLPALGSVPAQGLTIDELKREIDERYATEVVEGMEVTPVLVQRAPRYVFVVGEVFAPGRYTLEGPTTVMQSIAMAGSWKVGANLRQVVVFRRGDDWRLMATILDLQGALYAKRPCPADEIWINDSDVIVVPKNPILVANEFIEQVFTRGIYGVLPFSGISINFGKISSL